MRLPMLVAGLGALGACAPQGNQTLAVEGTNLEAAVDNMDLLADAAIANAERRPTEAAASGWVYQEKKDEMRGGSQKLASVEANDVVHLSAPYGDTTPVLHIRRDPKFGFNIYVTSEGQPLCRSYENETVSVKFDSGKVREWSCSESADGSPGVVFFNREKLMLVAIKHAKKLTMEIEYYDAGREQMTFPVAGLQW